MSDTVPGKEATQRKFLDGCLKGPIVIEPNIFGLDLPAWMEANRAVIDDLLICHGAVLFRGFRIDGQAGFSACANSGGTSPLEYVQRSTKRTKIVDGVYTSTEYPARYSIELHSENAFQYEWPQRLIFYSQVVAPTGGATPIADNGAVLDAIDPDISAEFIKRKIKYVRNFGGGLELSWQEAFQTDRREDVEDYCKTRSIVWKWKENDRVKTEQTLPAVICHGYLGRPLWFNQLHMFHISNLAFDVREALLSSMAEDDLPSTTVAVFVYIILLFVSDNGLALPRLGDGGARMINASGRPC